MLTLAGIRRLKYMADKTNSHRQTSPKRNRGDRGDCNGASEIIQRMLATATRIAGYVGRRGDTEMAGPTNNQNSRRTPLHEPPTRNVVNTDENIACHWPNTIPSHEPLSFWCEIEMR